VDGYGKKVYRYILNMAKIITTDAILWRRSAAIFAGAPRIVMTTPSSLSPTTPSIWPYIWLGLLAHLIWGSYPVFAKRAVMEVPKFSLLFFASFSATLVGFMLVRKRDGLSGKELWDTMRYSRVLWLLAFFVVLRSTTNIISIELTRATWVQLVNIMTPFPVAILGVLFFAQTTPPYTYRALLISTIGAVLMLVADWSDIFTGITPRDVLGLCVAIISTLALATYFQLVRRSHTQRASNGMIMVQQGVAMSTTFLILSLLAGEDWNQWLTVSTAGWLAVIGVVWLVQVGGNLVQITALGGTNPALVTSMMALRLVSALVLAWLILDEMLVSPTQWLGVIIVIGAVTTYLLLQRTSGKPARRAT